MEDIFVAKIVSMNRITIPRKVVEKLGLKEGDYIAVKIVKKVWDGEENED